jgi:hypothetical protein
MTDVYDQHRASFPHVSAFVVMHGSRHVGSIAFKFPRDGAGRLYAYVHWFGVPMVRGYAGGYGYDKKSAACSSAARKMPEHLPEGYDGAGDVYGRFVDALGRDGGQEWHNHLRKAGFDVLQAV